MKILHIYKDYAPVVGGIENHIRWLAEGLAARGHSIHVLVTNTVAHTRYDQIDGVSVTKCARQLNVSSAPVAFSMPLELRKVGKSADVVHLHAPYPPGELAQLLVRAGRRTVITYHSDIVKQATLLKFYAPFLRWALARADRILVSNPPYIQSSPFLRTVAQADPGKVQVVHFGIDVDRFAAPQPPKRVEQLRRQLGGDVLALFVGRLRYYKGVEVFLQALAHATQVTGVIVGSGGLEQELHARARSLDLGSRVRFAGSVPDDLLPLYYQAADMFVLPSIHRSESLGIVLLEAMASGLPLISTELGTGTSYVNQHRRTGLVVPPRDPLALAAAMETLANDANLRKKLGAAAQARAQAEFNIHRMVAQVEAVYESLF
ncbi:MAG: glycosyltransferase [Nitrospirae bacterium]|nr:MAG: glycosyltransferase [Nitrospirota bacterium]